MGAFSTLANGCQHFVKRNLLANLIRHVHGQTKPLDRPKQAFLDHGFVSVKLFDHTIVGSPPHPFRFWRQIPFVRMKATSGAKPRFDCRRALMTPGDAVHKLRGVSDLPGPFLSTSESVSAGGPPQHGGETVHMRAPEEPLSTAEMTPAGD